MTLKLKLVITACLTAFLAVVVGAVVNRVSTMQQEQVVAAATETFVPTEEMLPTETIAPTTATAIAVVDLAVVQQREAAYQAQLAQANLLLAEASARLAEAQGQANTVSQKYNDIVSTQSITPTAIPIPTEASLVYMPVESVTAVARALDADAVLQKGPELVLYENRAAYELVFDRGTVYIAADDGSVLSNGMAGFQTVSASTVSTSDAANNPAAPAKPAPTSVPAPTEDPAPNPDDNGGDNDDEDDDDEDDDDKDDDKSHD
jgi:hypothetical protein